MKLLLVSKTAIVIQIAQLVANKLELEFEVQNNITIKEKTEIILVDEEYISNDFNTLKQCSNKIGAISADKLPFDKSSDFELTRPFLPKQLNDILLEQIDLIKVSKNQEYITPLKTQEEKDESLVDVKDLAMYVESLADDIMDDINEESDESIVSLASMHNGGVLDNNELLKINDLLLEQNIQDDKNSLDEDDWKDLSTIIDDALTSVQDYEFSANTSTGFDLVLTDYSVKELKPLFKKVDDSILQKLKNGETIDIRLSLKANDEQ